MPMIDIYAVAGTFADPKQLAMDAANTVKTIEGVPDIPMFRKNTAAFVHQLPAGTLANVDGDENASSQQVGANAKTDKRFRSSGRHKSTDVLNFTPSY